MLQWHHHIPGKRTRGERKSGTKKKGWQNCTHNPRKKVRHKEGKSGWNFAGVQGGETFGKNLHPEPSPRSVN